MTLGHVPQHEDVEVEGLVAVAIHAQVVKDKGPHPQQGLACGSLHHQKVHLTLALDPVPLVSEEC